MSSVTQVAPLLAHGLLFGSLFACPSKPFAALELHVWRPRSTYFIVFEDSLTSISFVHALHSNNELTSFQSVNSDSFTLQVKVFPKYVTKTALQAQSSCRAKRGTYV